MLGIAACQVTAPGSFAEIDVHEFDIDPSISSFEAGLIELEVINTGDYGHTLVITDANGQVISAGEVVGSGEAATFSVDLAAGEYSFTCRIVAQDGQGNVIDHYEQGMMADVVVSAS
jgi:plastocyanin